MLLCWLTHLAFTTLDVYKELSMKDHNIPQHFTPYEQMLTHLAEVRTGGDTYWSEAALVAAGLRLHIIPPHTTERASFVTSHNGPSPAFETVYEDYRKKKPDNLSK